MPGDALHLPDLRFLDKLLHATAYAGLAFTCIFAAAPYNGKISHNRFGILIIFCCFLYGISDEFHQSFVPHRSVSGWDVVADIIGACIAVGIWLMRSRSKKTQMM